MKMIVAYTRHEAFEPIREELLAAGFPSLSVTEVKGSGRQKGVTQQYRGSQIPTHLRPKLKIECVVETGDAPTVSEMPFGFAPASPARRSCRPTRQRRSPPRWPPRFRSSRPAPTTS
jgi:hypothetical protein